uniref:Disease resistance RPP13-like protein 1 n=1 Tax=Vitis vinifera TaxID=29760 RepID=F6H948_VITVI
MAGAVAGGGALLSASLQVIFDRMASRDVLTFLRGQKLSATLLRKLQMKLLEVQAVLNDAEAKQITNLAVKDWVDELKDAVYDAEDLVDDITTEALRRKMESDSQTQVRNIIFGEGIESRVEEITDTLEYLSQKKDVLGLKKGVGENLSKRWPTTSLVDESGVYGRDVNREEIVKFLLSHNTSGNKISVIALVGMGGIGKTTLAKLVYNDRRVVEFFDLKAWVCVSNEFDLVRITKTILKAIDSGTRDDNDLNLLQHKLEERLTRKKFLLVLDDVWNEDYNDWDSLQTPFNVGLYGSKIIVTTRINKVAAVMHSVHTHHLAKLSSEDCCYYHLPSHLKPCFAYCSIFPKDYQFEKENLILLWMAEGFLQQSEKGKKTMEEIGDGYFYDLLSRSFFQKSGSNKSYFVMHDLMNDLAQLISGKVCVQLKDSKMNEIPEKLRHLSYFRSEYDRFERFEILNEVNSLRTFLPLNLEIWPREDKVSKRTYPYVQYLRVLSLCYYEITDLSDSIGNLKHLRYLDLTYTLIKRLPESVCNLYNLQTLILYYCKYLVELPKMMCKMISLRHLDIRHSKVKEMPSHMGQLKSLQKLSNYIVGKQSETRVGELRELCHIGGSLVIQELQNVVDAKDASEANMVGKQYLDELELEWNRGSDVEQNGADIVLNNLQPHSNIKRLTIYGYGGSRFPDWFGGPSILNMVSLRLWNCKNVSTFPPLGQLPSLKHLYILGLVEIERGMPKWKEWLCMGGQGGEFPRLKELYIMDCPQLTGDLPTHLPFLTRLWIKECEQLFLLLEFLKCPLPSLAYLAIIRSTCNSLSSFPLGNFPSLTYLKIYDLKGLESLSISISDGDLQLLTSLEKLEICDCPKLQFLTEGQLPTNLSVLTIQNCPLLKDRCKFWTGEDWHHIAHIPHIAIDDQVL